MLLRISIRSSVSPFARPSICLLLVFLFLFLILFLSFFFFFFFFFFVFFYFLHVLSLLFLLYIFSLLFFLLIPPPRMNDEDDVASTVPPWYLFLYDPGDSQIAIHNEASLYFSPGVSLTMSLFFSLSINRAPTAFHSVLPTMLLCRREQLAVISANCSLVSNKPEY